MDKWFEHMPTIETHNYKLRGIGKSDAKALFQFLKDLETMKFITPHPVQSEVEVETQIEEQFSRFQERKELAWAIIKKDTGTLIGTFRFHKLRLWHKSTEMGVVIHKDYQKQGVMSEILPALIEFAFQELNLNRLVGDIFAENQGSRKLLERFGFKKEGHLRQTDFDGERFHDTVVFGLLKEDV